MYYRKWVASLFKITLHLRAHIFFACLFFPFLNSYLLRIAIAISFIIFGSLYFFPFLSLCFYNFHAFLRQCSVLRPSRTTSSEPFQFALWRPPCELLPPLLAVSPVLRPCFPPYSWAKGKEGDSFCSNWYERPELWNRILYIPGLCRSEEENESRAKWRRFLEI